MGGPHLRAAGGEILEDYRGLAVTGLTEALAKLPRSFAVMKRLVADARDTRPDAVVLVDFPDFNFPLARRIKKLGIPIVYYISPQLWAWRAGRMKAMGEFSDRVLVIFPFEEAIYRAAGVPVAFVGHPLIDLIRTGAPRDVFLRGRGLDPAAPTVAILPGSRPNEVERMLPDLVASAARIAARVPGVQFVVARAPDLDDHLFTVATSSPLAQESQPRRMVVVEGQSDTVLAAADLALTASGTATVQTALHDTPMVVVYRTAPLTYAVVSRLVTVKFAAMVNLIAGEAIVPELIQHAFTPARVADEAVAILTDPARAARIREGLARVRASLGGPGASRRAADAIVQIAGVRTP